MTTDGAPPRGMTPDEVTKALALDEYPRVLSISEASTITGFSRDSLIRAIKAGELQAARASTDPRAHYRITRDHLRDYFARLSQHV